MFIESLVILGVSVDEYESIGDEEGGTRQSTQISDAVDAQSASSSFRFYPNRHVGRMTKMSPHDVTQFPAPRSISALSRCMSLQTPSITSLQCRDCDQGAGDHSSDI